MVATAEVEAAREVAEGAGMGPAETPGFLTGILNWATGVAESAAEFAADTTLSEEQLAFLDALGTTPEEIAALATDRTTIQEVIGERTPEQFLDALAESNPDLQNITSIIKDDPALTQAFHSAYVNNPSLHETFQEMMNATGEGAVSVADIEQMLSHPLAGSTARAQLTTTLTELANNPEMDASVLLEVAEQGRQALNLNFTEIIHRMQNDPAGLIREWIPADMANSEMGLALAGLLEGMMPFLATMIDPNGPILGDFVRLGGDAWDAAVQNGEVVFAAAAEQTGEGIDTVDPITRNFTEAGNMTAEEIAEASRQVAANLELSQRTGTTLSL